MDSPLQGGWGDVLRRKPKVFNLKNWFIAALMASMHPTDQEIFDRIRQNDAAAFRQLFDRHYRTLLGTAINVLKSQDQAQDIVQDTFFQVWKNRQRIEFHSSIEAYLKRAVINRCLNAIKQRKPFVDSETVVEEQQTFHSAIENLSLQELEVALKAALDKLPERCRLIFVMKRLEGMSQKEIAESLSISTKTVENQMTKAMKTMTRALWDYKQKLK